jgi:hypothetical protein
MDMVVVWLIGVYFLSSFFLPDYDMYCYVGHILSATHSICLCS